MAGSSHGHTPAAWTSVIIIFVGFCVGGAFMVAADPLGFWVGVAVILIGGIIGLLMKAMGLGMPKESAAMVQARADAGRAQGEPYAPYGNQPQDEATAGNPSQDKGEPQKQTQSG